MESPTAKRGRDKATLLEWERATIEIFVHTASLVGLPRSIGEIYGLLYCAPEPLTFDELAERLGISRGSVSQGLKILRKIRAIQTLNKTGSRKEFYQPELSMKRLVSGFIRDQFAPHLESGESSLDEVEALIAAECTEPEAHAHAMKRLETLRTWRQRTRRLFPIIMAALSSASFFESKAASAPDDYHVI